MSILVTGGRGFIGTNLVAALLRQTQEQILVMDKGTYAANPMLHHPRLTYSYAGVEDREGVRCALRLARPSVVFHLAAETHVARSIETADAFIKTNVHGTFTLLDELSMMGGAKPLFIHMSTDEVYGSLSHGEEPWTEQSPYAPNNPYSASKAASDFLVRAWLRTHRMPAIIVHAANNYGPYQHVEKLIPAVINMVRDGTDILIHGDGRHVRDWIHVEDTVRGLYHIWQHGYAGSTYNMGGDCERTTFQIVGLVVNRMRKISHPIRQVPDRPGNDRRYAMVSNMPIGWRVGLPIEDRLGEVIDWYLQPREEI